MSRRSRRSLTTRHRFHPWPNPRTAPPQSSLLREHFGHNRTCTRETKIPNKYPDKYGMSEDPEVRSIGFSELYFTAAPRVSGKLEYTSTPHSAVGSFSSSRPTPSHLLELVSVGLPVVRFVRSFVRKVLRHSHPEYKPKL